METESLLPPLQVAAIWPPVPILSQINPAHALPPILFPEDPS
jgi:hypothetical protein